MERVHLQPRWSPVHVPEPSSLTLVMLLVGDRRLASRCRRFLTGKRLSRVLALLGLAAVATPASAELLFYDPFLIGTSPAAGEYMVDTVAWRRSASAEALGGQNPVAPYGTQPDLLTGPWVAVRLPRARSKSAPGLNYIGAPAEGGSIGTVPDPVDFWNR